MGMTQSTSVHVGIVNFGKAHWKKSFTTLANWTNLPNLAINNLWSLAKISINNSQKFFKQFFNIEDELEYKKLHSQKLNLKSNSQHKKDLKEQLEEYNVGIGNWRSDETLQIFAKLSDICLDFEQTQQFNCVRDCFQNLLDDKRYFNIEGKLKNMCNNILPELEKEYEKRQHYSYFQINYSNLNLELKKIVKKELFIINEKSKYLKKSIVWFENLKKINESMYEKLNSLIETNYCSFSLKIGKHCHIFISEQRISKLFNKFKIYFKKKEYTNKFFDYI